MASDISTRTWNKMWLLFDEYAAEVNASELTESSKRDYISFAEMFVRWVGGDFTPGEAKGKQQS